MQLFVEKPRLGTYNKMNLLKSCLINGNLLE